MQLSKILLFGGSFDPIHNGHIQILKNAIDLIKPDLTFIIPTNQNYQKQTMSTTSQDRLKMLDLVFKNWSGIEICEYEINQTNPAHTIDTVNYFRNKYHEAEIYLLIGGDQWNNIQTWKKHKILKQKVHFVVANRDNKFEISHQDIIVLQNDVLPIASSQIRSNPRFYDCPYEVMTYINEHGLYGIERIKNKMSEKRFQHSLRVAYYAKKLMEKHNANIAHLAYSAGIYHDFAKEQPDLNMQEEIAKTKLGLFDYAHPKLLHGYIGAYFLRQQFCFTNETILNAICRHTKPFDYYTNQPDTLTKVLYLADKLEPNRSNDDVFGEDIESFRQLALEDLDQCFEKLYNLLQKNLSKK